MLLVERDSKGKLVAITIADAKLDRIEQRLSAAPQTVEQIFKADRWWVLPTVLKSLEVLVSKGRCKIVKNRGVVRYRKI